MVKQKWLIWCLVACFLFAIPCEVNAGQKDISGADLLKNRYETQMKANVVTLEEIKMQDEILEMYSMIDEKIKYDEENSASYAGGYIDAKGNLVVCTTSKEYKRKIEYCVKEEIEAEKMEYIELDNVKYH